jgi:hypothetical protein
MFALEGVNMMRKIVVLAVLLGLPITSQANFVFNIANTGLAGNNTVVSPYADLSITDSTTDNTLTALQVKFDLTLMNGNNAKFGALGFNLNGISAVDISLASLAGTGGDYSAWGFGGGGQMDGFGNFDLQVSPGSNSNDNRLSSLTFILQFQPGHEVDAKVSSFVALNSGAGNPPGSWYFSAEYFPNSGLTGFIGGRSDAVMANPAPSTIVMLGIAGMCCGAYRRYRRKA